MINTKCPECTARFYVSEELVTGKVVRFRCRKCGGTITVDGTKSSDGSGEEATDGADAALLSRLPPAPSPVGDSADKIQIKEPEKRPGTLRPSAGLPPPAKGDQQFPRPPRPPSNVDTPEPVAVEVKEKVDDAGDEIDEPTDKVQKSKVQIDEPMDKVQKSKVEVDEPTDKVQKSKVQVDKPTDKASPIEAKPVPVPKTAEPAKSALAAKSSAGDDDPTALWQKNKGKKKEETPNAPPASKPRLSRVSMDLGSVFDMPADEEEVDVPLEMDDEPAFEEELEPESMSSEELEPGSLSPESLKSLGAMPKPGAPPPPKIKPPPPKPKSTNLDRPSSARVDIRAALSRPAEVSDLKAPDELFAPVAIPANTLSDLASVPDEPEEDEKVHAAPVLSPALSPALVSAEPSPTSVRAKEEREHGSNRGMIIGAAVLGVLILAGVGFFATRGDEAPASPPTNSTATAEPTEQPAPTTTAASPATGTAEPTEPAKTPEEPAEPAATETAAAAQPAGTTTSEPKTVAGATPTAVPTAPAVPTATATATATAQPTATAATATATAEPTKAPPPKPPDTGGEKPPFNKGAAASAIGALKGAAQGCKQADGPQGHARVSVTFAPSGRVTVATVTGPPFAGTPVGGCIAATFRRATVPPFSGSNVTVHTSVAIF